MASARVGACTLSMKENETSKRKMNMKAVMTPTSPEAGQAVIGGLFINAVSMISAASSCVTLGVVEMGFDSCAAASVYA